MVTVVVKGQGRVLIPGAVEVQLVLDGGRTDHGHSTGEVRCLNAAGDVVARFNMHDVLTYSQRP